MVGSEDGDFGFFSLLGVLIVFEVVFFSLGLSCRSSFESEDLEVDFLEALELRFSVVFECEWDLDLLSFDSFCTLATSPLS